MGRAPFQVLVLPFRTEENGILYAIFRRKDTGIWQGIAGGGEGKELPLEAATRELVEETGLPPSLQLIPLQTISSIPVTEFQDSAAWGEQRYVVPEHCFGVDVESNQIRLSGEHTEYGWLRYGEAVALLRYDGNRTALWELNQKVRGLGPRQKPP
jgi:dATP pyrophosphohydrolase